MVSQQNIAQSNTLPPSAWPLLNSLKLTLIGLCVPIFLACKRKSSSDLLRVFSALLSIIWLWTSNLLERANINFSVKLTQHLWWRFPPWSPASTLRSKANFQLRSQLVCFFFLSLQLLQFFFSFLLLDCKFNLAMRLSAPRSTVMFEASDGKNSLSVVC